MDLYHQISHFYRRYRGEKRIIGRSEEGRAIYAMRLGEGDPVCISQYAIHAREWITAYLALAHLRRPLSKGSIWVVPLSNPDGALLSTVGAKSVADPARRAYLTALNGGTDFSLWKANADGVDLNVNFDARWGQGRYNITSPASANYIGSDPFCARESRALRDLTLAVRPRATLSWHTKGEEIYWRFHQPKDRLLRDRRIAEGLARHTGYALAEARASVGGYKDWCIMRLGIPAFTIEAGSEHIPHPLSFSALAPIIRQTEGIFEVLIRELSSCRNST